MDSDRVGTHAAEGFLEPAGSRAEAEAEAGAEAGAARVSSEAA